MPYITLGEFYAIEYMTKRLNDFASNYRSFRVVTIFEKVDSCDTMALVALCWINDIDLSKAKAEKRL